MAGMYMGDPMRVPSLYNPQQGGFPSLRGQNPSFTGMFDTPSYQTPGIGDGVNARMAEYQVPASVMQQDQPIQPQQAAKPGAWGKGGRAWQIMGVIGDALQTAGGGEATFMPAFLDLQEQTRKERETQQKLQAQVAAMAGIGLNAQQSAAVQAGVAQASDFMPKPPNNDTVNDYNFIASKFGSATADEYLRNLGDPIVTIPLPNGTVFSGPRSGLAAAMSGEAPQTKPKPVGKLTPITGGGVSDGTGGFQRR